MGQESFGKEKERESGEHEKKSFKRRIEGLGKGNLGKEKCRAAAASEDIHTRPKLPSAPSERGDRYVGEGS